MTKSYEDIIADAQIKKWEQKRKQNLEKSQHKENVVFKHVLEKIVREDEDLQNWLISIDGNNKKLNVKKED